MALRLNGSTSGYAAIDAPAVAGNNTLVLPTGNGSNGQFLQGNGSGTLSWSGSLTLGTAQNSTSGTSITFTGIPSWAKRVTMMLNSVTISGSSQFLIQIGSGSINTSGYNSAIQQYLSAFTSSTAGWVLATGTASSYTTSGSAIFNLFNSNIWVGQTSVIYHGAAASNGAGVSPALSGSLDRIRLTTVNGTDTFTGGSINIMYEG